MVQEHPGAGVSHDLFDLHAQVRFITMDWASAASRFVLLIRTACKPQAGIGDERAAFITEISGTAMMGTTIESNHGLHGSSLIVHTEVSGIHGLVLPQFFQDLRTDILLGQSVAWDRDIRVAQIDGQSFIKQIREALIRSFGKSSCRKVSDPGLQRIHCSVQKDHDSVLS